MDKEQEREKVYADIMYLFRYFYQDEWAPENIFDGKSRFWIKTFNGLVENGLIEREKSDFGFQYRWAGIWPDEL